MPTIKYVYIILLTFVFMFVLFPSPAVAALNRLDVRTTATGGEFYDTVTGKKIILRGNNYQRIKNIGTDANAIFFHSNFNSDTYDRSKAAGALNQMKLNGYNSVRVFINQDSISTSISPDLSITYLNNMVDFIKLAQDNNIYVFIQISVSPHNTKYSPTLTDTKFEQTDYFNTVLLNSTKVIAKKNFVKDLIQGLINQGAPMNAIMGYSIINEPYFEKDKKPLSLSTGIVQTANGQLYNLSIPSDIDRMVEDALVYYVDTLRETIKEVSPNALVGITLLSPVHTVVTNQNWLLKTGKVFNTSQADFIAINSYPGFIDFVTEMNAYKIGSSQKPIVVGEFGAYPSKFSTLTDGANALKQFQIQTCSQYSVTGWFLYDWDTFEYDKWFRIYHGTEGNGEIYKALAPNFRADPCKSEYLSPIVGSLDKVSCSSAIGWAGNTATPNTTLNVHIYADGVGPSHFLGVASANQPREQLVCDEIGSSEASCPHGFTYPIPELLKDGKPHVIDSYVIDNTQNPKLPNSTRTITCLPDVITGDYTEDGKVDIVDFNKVTQFFGNPYTISDFNKVISNFGK